MGGSGREELKSYPLLSPAVLSIVNVREGIPRLKKNGLIGYRYLINHTKYKITKSNENSKSKIQTKNHHEILTKFRKFRTIHYFILDHFYVIVIIDLYWSFSKRLNAPKVITKISLIRSTVPVRPRKPLLLLYSTTTARISIKVAERLTGCWCAGLSSLAHKEFWAVRGKFC